jgi:hypothetical protein
MGWMDILKSKAPITEKHVSAGAAILREVGEGALVGGALGAAHAMLPLGLDLDGKVPLDGVLAGVGILGGVGMAHEEYGQDLRNIGASAATVFSFRKVYAFAAAKKMANTALAPEKRIPGDRLQEQNVALKASQKGQAKVAGEFGFGADVGAEDPIVVASRSL